MKNNSATALLEATRKDLCGSGVLISDNEQGYSWLLIDSLVIRELCMKMKASLEDDWNGGLDVY